MRLLIDPGIKRSPSTLQAQWPVVLINEKHMLTNLVYLKQHHLADGVAEPMEYVNCEFFVTFY